MKKRVIILLLITSLIALLFPTNAIASEKAAVTRIWIGDSRTVGLKQTVKNSNDKFIAKSGMSITWFKNEAIPKLKSILTDNSVVIINMGVNDCAATAVGDNDNYINEYIKTINKLIKEYPNIKFYYMSVNPANGNYPSTYSNTGYIEQDKLNNAINKLNKNMKEKCNANFIDTNTYLYTNGFETIDGLHYDTNTTKKIYNYCLKNLPKEVTIAQVEIETNKENNKKEEVVNNKENNETQINNKKKY